MTAPRSTSAPPTPPPASASAPRGLHGIWPYHLAYCDGTELGLCIVGGFTAEAVTAERDERGGNNRTDYIVIETSAEVRAELDALGEQMAQLRAEYDDKVLPLRDRANALRGQAFRDVELTLIRTRRSGSGRWHLARIPDEALDQYPNRTPSGLGALCGTRIVRGSEWERDITLLGVGAEGICRTCRAEAGRL